MPRKYRQQTEREYFMLDEDYKEFANEWNLTLSAKGQPRVAPDVMVMNFEDLSFYRLDQVLGAIKKFRINPDIGKYHLQVSSIVEVIEGDSHTSSVRAWELVKKAQGCGSAFDLIINDPVSMKVIEEMGGLTSLCNHSDEFSVSDYTKRFQVLYKYYRLNPPEKYPDILRGTNYHEFKSHGLPTSRPTMIGFQETQRKPLPCFEKPRYPQIANANKENSSPSETKNWLEILSKSVTPDIEEETE